MDQRARAGRTQGGFALILAILALMLLTFLGLTLATTTSQELQIATNYRWNQQALYNAEAGLEIGKAVLRTAKWDKVLPPDRGISWTIPTYKTDGAVPSLCPNCTDTQDAQNRNLRNFENSDCDAAGGKAGFGVILNDDVNSPFQYMSGFGGQPINGTFTIWVRRQVVTDASTGGLKDSDDPEKLVMTVEGTAPYLAAAATISLAQTNRAVKYLEFSLSRKARPDSTCGTRAGQAGAGPEGANFGGCVDITAATVAEGLGLATGSISEAEAQ